MATQKQQEALKLLIERSLSRKELSFLLKITPEATGQLMERLVKSGFVETYGQRPKFYKINEMSLGVRNLLIASKQDLPIGKSKISASKRAFIKKSLYLHDYKVKYRIIKQGIAPPGIERKKHNWTARFYDFEKPFKYRIELTTKSLIIYLYQQELPRNLSYEQAIHVLTSTVTGCALSFATMNGFKIDIFHSKVINQHISQNPARVIDERIPDNLVATRRLGKKARAITGKMPQEALAWLDKSKGLTDIETNDLAYEKMLLEMPITVSQFKAQFALTAEYNRNLKLHIEVMQEIKKTLKDIRDQKR